MSELDIFARVDGKEPRCQVLRQGEGLDAVIVPVFRGGDQVYKFPMSPAVARELAARLIDAAKGL